MGDVLVLKMSEFGRKARERNIHPRKLRNALTPIFRAFRVFRG